MKTLRFLALLTLIFISAMKTKAQPAVAPLPARNYNFSITRKTQMQYLLYLPADYKPKGPHRWPLMLFLHGAGERGTNVQRVAIHGPLSRVREGKTFPFIIVAPLCPEGEIWDNESLLKLLDHVDKKFAVDTDHIYLTGLSMGGYGTWKLGLAHPERFAAIAPVCGGANMIDIILGSRDKGAAFQSLPIWTFHGAKDDVVPLNESERVVDALKKNGANDIKLTVYPDAKHDSWKEAYKTDALYDWLLAHSLSDPARRKK